LNNESATQDEQVPRAFLELKANQEEFQLNVDRVKIPHASTVAEVDTTAMQVVLKMHRPLAAELPSETLCRVSIGALGEHWKVTLEYLNRVSHLHYLFNLPKTMEKAGRREHKRYPFRPRENVTVYVQDASLPGMGAVGTLLDLSLGGLAFRPERAFTIENGARLKLDTAMFEKGKTFPVIRVDGLPKLTEPLRVRGEVAHVMEKSDTLFVAFVFGVLEDWQDQALATVAEAREKMGGQGGPPPSSGSPSASAPDESAKTGAGPADAGSSSGTPAGDASAAQGQEKPHIVLPEHLLRLARRTTSLLLIKPSGAPCNEVYKSLKDAGYVRIEHCEALDSHIAQTVTNTDFLLVALELGGEAAEPLKSFRNLCESIPTRSNQVAVVITERYDPILLHESEEMSMPIGFTQDKHWVEVLDNELELA
jgi:hypothetical protein